MSTYYSNQRGPHTWTSSEQLLRSIPSVLFARKWVIVFSVILTFGLTAIATWFTPPVYVASASILVKKERFDAAVTPEQVIATGQPDRHLTEEELNSEVEILNSSTLHEQVIKRMHLERAFKSGAIATALARLSREQQDPNLSDLANAITRFEENLTVEPGKKSNLIKITYKDIDRQRAADVVSALCSAYQERHISLRQNDTASNFFTEQAEEMRRDLNSKDDALKSVTSLPNQQLLNQQIEIQIRQLNEFEVGLQNARAAIAESEARIHSLQNQLAREPERLTGEERISHRTAPEAVRAQLFSLELRRTELAARYKPDHRLIKDLDKDIEKARQMVTQIESAPAESMVTTTVNPIHQRLRETLNAEQSNLSSLREKERLLSSTTARTSARVKDLGERGYQQRRLDRDRELADNAYQLYAKKGQESRVSKALDQQGIVNIMVAEPAHAPFKAASPNVPVNLLLGLVGGLLIGLASVATLEYFRPAASQIPMTNPRGNYLNAVANLGGRQSG